MIYRLANVIYNTDGKQTVAPVAQLDRASDFESAGRPFESDRARQIKSGGFCGCAKLQVGIE